MVGKEGLEQKAVIVVDMQKDNVGRFSKDIVPNIKLLLEKAREKGVPVIFACDSRYPDDFLFTRRGHPPRAIRGTEGAKVIDEFAPRPTEVIVEKRMLSGFFESDLDFTIMKTGQDGTDKPEKVPTLKAARESAEISIIRTALQATKGNVSQASTLLEIDRKWLITRMKEYGIDADVYRKEKIQN